jgi:DNA-binding HxlR family transcriptional regulator
MSRTDLADKTCTIARTVELLGDAWTLLIMREMFLAGRRFDELQRQTGASPHILSQRLKRLEGAGVVRREAYSERPPRHEYRLTAMGRELWPVIISMKQWGDKWFDDTTTHVEITHKGCGATVMPHMICPDCGEPMLAHDAEPHLSPEYERERAAARRQP